MTIRLLRFNYNSAALLGFVALLSLSSAQAVDTIDCPAKGWSVGLYEHGLLFFHGRSGIDKDIVNEIRKSTGCKLYSSLMPNFGLGAARRRHSAWFSVSKVQLH